MNPFNAALVFLALGAAALPALAGDRLPRAGGAVDAVVIIDEAPAVRRPRAGGSVLPTDAEVALNGSGTVLGITVEDADLCGRKYCGAGSAR